MQTRGWRSTWTRAREKFSLLPASPLQPGMSQRMLDNCHHHPKISLVVPVFRPRLVWLERCLRSVRNQHYPVWELVVVDDGSRSDRVSRTIESHAAADERIAAHVLPENEGIAAATNVALERCSGEFVGFLDHDDMLTPDALTWIAAAHNRFPDAVWFYSDEAKTTPNGMIYDVVCKPRFAPELLLSTMYTCHFSVYATSALRELTGVRRGFDAAQDHDLALRMSEHVDLTQVVHIPQVLYYWRAGKGSTASSITAKPHAPAAGRRAVREALARRQIRANVRSSSEHPTVYELTLKPSSRPPVDLLTHVAGQLVAPTEAALRRLMVDEYGHCSVAEFGQMYGGQSMASGPPANATPRAARTGSHWSRLSGALEAILAVNGGEYIALVDVTCTPLAADWLAQLVATCELDRKIAAAGCLWLDDDGRVDNAGYACWENRVVALGRGEQFASGGYCARFHGLHDIPAVSPGLMLVRRSALATAEWLPSGHEEHAFAMTICSALRDAGHRVVLNPVVRASRDSLGRSHQPAALPMRRRGQPYGLPSSPKSIWAE